VALGHSHHDSLGRGTVNHSSSNSNNSTSNSAVAVGVTDSQVCGSVGVYKTGAGVFFLPAHFLLPGSTPGSTIGASSLLINPGAGSLGDQALRKGCSGPHLSQVDMNFVKKTRIMEKLTFQSGIL
jgi:hypothetical protein